MINQPDSRTDQYAPSREPVNPGVADASVRTNTTGGSYAESRQTHYVDSAGNQTENVVQVYQDKNLARANKRSWVAEVVYFVLSVLEVILALRFFFRLLGASQNSGFTQFLYNLSHVFVAPFYGIFHDLALGSSSVFEPSTLIAMLVFALLAWGLVALSRVVFASNDSGRQQAMTTRSRQ